MNRRSIKKYHKLALPALGFGLGLAILGGIIPSVASASVSINKSVSVEDSLWNVSEDLGKPIGTVRYWQNNGFSGVKTRDGGFAALTGTSSVSRTDSFGNVLWTFDPSNENIKGYDSSWKNKKAVEIVQDKGAGYQNVFYVLLAPQETPETNNKIQADSAQEYSYSSITSDKTKQATVVQIVENITGFTSNSQWQTSYAVVKSVDINPRSMVDNYPESWKQPSRQNTSKTTQDGVSFFSVTQHASWYDDQSGNSGFVMPWRQYITNLGNMYGFQGRLFIFGGNGTVFNDPEALSIGLFRINFYSETIEVTGIPYAFVFSGISWFLTEQPSVDGSTGIYHSQSRPIEYDSKVPMGQDKNFSYVPRMAVAGIQPSFDLLDGQAPSYLYIAGTITTGQNKESQEKTVPVHTATQSLSDEISNSNTQFSSTGSSNVITTKNWNLTEKNGKSDGWNAVWDKTSTRSLHQSGENYIASQPLSGSGTSENSIDPLTLFGTPLSMSALMSFESKTSTNPYEYTNLMFNGRYYDIGIFPGYQSGQLNDNRIKKQPFRGDRPGQTNNNNNNAITTMIAELTWSMRTLTIPTLSYGYSTKSVSGLTQFTDKDGNNGYSFQVGAGVITFTEPKFDIKSIVYRNLSLTLLDDELIGDPYVGGQVNSNGTSDTNNFYWFNNNSSVNLDTISRPQNGVIFDNWKVEDYTATWQYSLLSKQVQKNSSESSTKIQTFNDVKSNETKLNPKLDFGNFRGLSTTLNDENNYNSNIGSIWSSESISGVKTLNTKNTSTLGVMITDSPLMSVYGDDITRNAARAGKAHQNSNFFIASKNRNDSNSGSTFNALIYQPTNGGDSTSKSDTSNQFNNYQEVDKEINIVFPSSPELPQSDFTGQFSGDKNLVSMTYDNEASSLDFEVKNATERSNTLGSGTFTGALSNDLLQKNISDLFDFNVNVPGVGSNQTVLNKKWLPQFFDVKQQPNLDKVENSQSIDAVKLVVTNMDLVTQSMTLTAYAYNQDTGTYAFMPSSNGDGNFASISVAKFTGFKALAAWVLPVAIAVPIVVISLVIGLGLGIGLPMQKNKQMLKLGFELQNKKVDTLTTAVGGVFKKIINQTKTDNLKKAPQMLKAASPKPATPSAAPKAPGTAPKAPTSPTAKVQGPSAAPKVMPKPPGSPAAPAAPA